MEISLGCSIDELRTTESYQQFSVINIENPLYPGYLEHDYQADLAYLERAVHQRLILDGPYIDLNVGSPEPRARQLALDKVLEAIAFAERCHAEEIVFLSNFLPFIGVEFYERGWIQESIRSWHTILARPDVVRVALCNTFEYDPSPLLQIVKAVGHSRLGLAFDVGHCLLWGKTSALEWYRQVRDLCRVVYLHSNNGQADEHRSIQTGRLAELEIVPSLRQELRTDSIVILKYFNKNDIETDLRYLAGQLAFDQTSS
jgi:sugar phosphate isomerase/epimerase